MDLGEFKNRVARAVNETLSTIDDDLLNDAMAAALVAILPWVSKISLATLEGDNDLTEFDLPADFYRILSLQDKSTGYILPEAGMQSDAYRLQNVESGNNYILLNSQLSFQNAPYEDVDMMYGALWTVPEDDTDEIETPLWTHPIMVYYGAFYVLSSEASDTAEIRQWNINVDSGTPAMNPKRDQAQYFLQRFNQEMNQHPATGRGSR
jgi:hypothetical protein